MSEASRSLAGILLVLVPTVQFGGMALLGMISRRDPGYMDNETRRFFWRAGHAHAGVLLALALLALLYVDQAELSDGFKSFVRSSIAAAPILIPAGFFFSVPRRTSDRPNRLIALIYLGAISLAVAVVILGVGLIR